jgi:hypothetical protein
VVDAMNRAVQNNVDQLLAGLDQVLAR